MKRLRDRGGRLHFVIGGPDDPEWVWIGRKLRRVLREHFGGPREAFTQIALTTFLLDEAIQLQIRVLKAGGLELKEEEALDMFLELARKLWATNLASIASPERPS